MKNKIIILFITSIVLFLAPQNILAESISDNEAGIVLESEDGVIVQSGTWDNISWTLDSEGKLVLSGSGIVEDGSFDSVVGWDQYKNDIKMIKIEEGITGIGHDAFRNYCNLEEVIISESVEEIGNSAFYGCANLTNIIIPNGVKIIGDSAFCGCTNLTNITIPNSVKDIGSSAFAECQIQHLYYTGTMSRGAFLGRFRDCAENIHCSDGDILASDQYSYIVLPDGTIEIIKYWGNEDTLMFPNKINGISVTSIGDGTSCVLSDSRTVSVIIPDNVKHIGAYAFYHRSELTNITIPEGVESIGEFAFCWDYGITSLKLPRSIKNIGNAAFAENDYLTDIYYAGTKAEWKCIQFGLVKFYFSGIIIHCLDGNLSRNFEDISDDIEADIPKGPDTWKGKVGIDGFVSRLYNVALTREAEQNGYEDWYQCLETKAETAAEVAYGFIFSDEFKNKKYNDIQFIKVLYQTMFGREADETGMKDWLSALENGMSREYVYRGFAESAEFTNLCNSYDVERGEVTLSAYRDQNRGATGFIARLYTKMLGREFDDAGIEDWCGRYLRGEYSIENIATDGFLHSEELKNQNLSNEEFVTRMYQTFLNREPDEAGLKDWIGRLERGEETRDSLVYGFTNSQEFGEIKASYGL